MAHKWARWLRRALPLRGSPALQSGGQNQKWPINGQGGYVTHAASGIPTALERGAESEVAHKWARWLHHPCRSGIPTASERGAKSEVAHKWARWLHHPCRLGDPHNFRAGGQNQRWPINGQGGYITPAASGIPTASERGGAKSEVAHKWARWLHHPCRLGDPHRFRAGGQNQKWPTNGQGDYITPAASGIPTSLERGGKIRSGP